MIGGAACRSLKPRPVGPFVYALLVPLLFALLVFYAPPSNSQSGRPDAEPAEAIQGGTAAPPNEGKAVVAFIAEGLCGGSVVWKDRSRRDYILSAYHCVDDVVQIKGGECVTDPAKLSGFFISYVHNYIHPKVGVTKICRQPESTDPTGELYGSDVLLVITDPFRQVDFETELFPVARFDASPQDYGKLGRIYGYSDGKTDKPGVLMFSDAHIDGMGYSFDVYGGNAISASSIKGKTLEGDSGGPLVFGETVLNNQNEVVRFNESVAGVLSGGAGKFATFSRIDPRWLQKEANSLLITAPKSGAYLSTRRQTLKVRGIGAPNERIQVVLRVGDIGGVQEVFCGDSQGFQIPPGGE